MLKWLFGGGSTDARPRRSARKKPVFDSGAATVSSAPVDVRRSTSASRAAASPVAPKTTAVAAAASAPSPSAASKKPHSVSLLPRSIYPKSSGSAPAAMGAEGGSAASRGSVSMKAQDIARALNLDVALVDTIVKDVLDTKQAVNWDDIGVW